MQLALITANVILDVSGFCARSSRNDALSEQWSSLLKSPIQIKGDSTYVTSTARDVVDAETMLIHVKPSHRQAFECIRALSLRLYERRTPLMFRWVPRRFNIAADEIVNAAMDKRAPNRLVDPTPPQALDEYSEMEIRTKAMTTRVKTWRRLQEKVIPHWTQLCSILEGEAMRESARGPCSVGSRAVDLPATSETKQGPRSGGSTEQRGCISGLPCSSRAVLLARRDLRFELRDRHRIRSVGYIAREDCLDRFPTCTGPDQRLSSLEPLLLLCDCGVRRFVRPHVLLKLKRRVDVE